MCNHVTSHILFTLIFQYFW